MTWKSIGPLSYQGSGKKQVGEAPRVALRVEPLPSGDGMHTSGRPALVSHDDWGVFAAYLAGAPAFLQLASGSDCLVALTPSAEVPQGTVRLEHAARVNLHVVGGDVYTFSVWEGPEDGAPLDLVEVELEVRPLEHARPSLREAAGSDDDDDAGSRRLAEGGSTTSACDADRDVDAEAVVRELMRTHAGRMLATNQLVPLTVAGRGLLLRVCATDVLDAESRAAALTYHCFRGRLAPDTTVYLHGGPPETSAAAAPPSTPLQLLRARARRPDAPRDVVNVHTNDGELFPVKRRMLRPCIALTAAVRSAAAAVDAAVDVDTLTFDRALIFLEALARGEEPPNFGAHLVDALLDAGRKLGCQSLVSYCEDKLGRLQTRITVHSWAEVRAANARGLCWLALDGMVLDVTTWLPEHPGGSSIIPAQALDLDCSRFFEVYHASRESFLYLKEFYIGEVAEHDLDQVPRPEEPSAEFVEQLRSFTPWRISARDERTFKSF